MGQEPGTPEEIAEFCSTNYQVTFPLSEKIDVNGAQRHPLYAEQGFSVVGVPCNQFMGQEPGTHEEIVEFCSTTYGVTFPLMEKIDVNGDDRHALYEVLTATADAEGVDGDIRWNFEKFLVDRDGNVVARFAPQIDPEADEVISAIEAAL
jgi:glutathione peroxidase